MSVAEAKPSEQDAEHYARLLKEAESIRGVSLGQDAWRQLRKNRVAMAALVYLMLLAVLAVFTPLLPLQAPRKDHTSRQFAPPTFRELGGERLPTAFDDGTDRDPLRDGFGDLNRFNRGLLELRVQIFGDWSIPSLCGTDKLGRDILSRLFWGARISLIVGLVAALVSLVIGVSYGAIAGYFGGFIDDAMMRLVDVLYSIPFIFVVIFLITILSEDSVPVAALGGETVKGWLESHGINRIMIFFLVVGAIYWLTMARVVRGQVISLKREQFVEAARTIGAGRARIIFRHIVPNLFSVIIVYLTLTIPQVMLFEAFLSFLGLGVAPPDVSWGLLANEGVQAITSVRIYWWLVVFPGLALGLTLFALNFLGDGLRDALDPRLKNKG